MKALVALIAAAAFIMAASPASAKFCYKNGKPYICDNDSGKHVGKRDCEPKE